jgi:RNA polymerase sigma-70 factor (ECF subfamily)
MTDTQMVFGERFEAARTRLRAVAYRMLGSLSDADDAVQEAWLRLSRSDPGAIRNLDGWLTTVVARVCLDMLRSRKSRREEPLGVHLPDPIVSFAGENDPEREALLADSVGLALLVVLEQLSPAERLAYVLHDVFDLSFDEIAAIVERSPDAARQLASRARRRVQGATPPSDTDLARQRGIVDAFVAAARGGNFEALLAVLDPDVVLRVDRGGKGLDALQIIRGAQAAGRRAALIRGVSGLIVRPAIVNGTAGIVSWLPDGRPLSIMGFTIAHGKIVEIDVLADPERLRRLDLPPVP